jgi:tetratricopeptide (TPR) repeat protein
MLVLEGKRMNRIGRNDPCPCGSGLKYKKCCLNKGPDVGSQSDDIAGIRAKAFKQMAERNWDDAIKGFMSIVDSDSDKLSILEAIAACYDGADDFLRAAEFFEKCLSLSPSDREYEFYHRLAVARACANRIDKAVDALRSASERAADETTLSQSQSLIHQLERIQKGEENPHLFLLHVQLQRAFSDMEEDRFDEAAQRLEKILPVDPTNPAILYNLGVVYTFLKRENEALEYFEKTITYDPTHAQAWYNMGQLCLIRKNDYSRAIHCFERATTARPGYVSARYQQGVAWEMLGDKKKALSCWRQTLELEPEHKLAKENVERLEEAISAASA